MITEITVECIIGIDPGASGGIAIFRPNEKTMAFKIPASIEKLNDFLKYQKEITPYCMAFIERVGTFWDDSKEENKGKQFRIQKLISQYAEIKSILTINKIPYIQVYPVTWQTYLRIKQSGEEKQARKNRFKRIAQKRYPEVSVTLWNSDALLLVEFGRSKLQFDVDWIIKQIPRTSLQTLL